jgi:hypothetical protein
MKIWCLAIEDLVGAHFFPGDVAVGMQHEPAVAVLTQDGDVMRRLVGCRRTRRARFVAFDVRRRDVGGQPKTALTADGHHS